RSGRAFRRGRAARWRLARSGAGAGAFLAPRGGALLPAGPLAARIRLLVIAGLRLGQLERWSGETALRQHDGGDDGADQKQVFRTRHDIRFQLFFRR
ncbi:MAG: hypothetical protein C0458_29475, partial [Methylobacterium sp.]|nr:hypothetical protein [Methylobacterium sp.]